MPVDLPPNRAARIGRAVVAALVLSACASLQRDISVCPEYRELRCVGETVCASDPGRSCKVCRCRGFLDPKQDPVPDESRPPDLLRSTAYPR
jgi:hypothetical protein